MQRKPKKWLSFLIANLMVVTVVLSAFAIPGKAVEAATVNLVTNPGFESDLTGWTYSDTDGALTIQNATVASGNIRSGSKSAKYWKDSNYSFTLTQTITGLENGEYVLKAWSSGDPGNNTLYLFADNYGGVKQTAAINNSGWGTITPYTIQHINVTGGHATIGFEVNSSANKWGFFDDVEFYKVDNTPTWESDNKSLTVSAITATSLTLNWTGMSDPSIVTGYHVYQGDELLGTTTGTSYEIADLTPDTDYTFKVEAGNSAGQWSADGPTTVERTGTTTATPPTWIDGNLTISSVTSKGLVLTWSGATDDVGVTRYRIYENGIKKMTVTGTTYQITDLTPNTSYTYRVQAGDADLLWSTDGPNASVTTPAIPAEPFIKGADISTLQAIEDAGGKYYDNGVEKDLLDILQDHGVNYIRLRIWNNPVEADGYNDKAHVVAMAKRVKAKGMKLLLDFHYSDFWADPGKQVKPEAWKDLNFNELQQAVYDYTADVMGALKTENAYPDMVQIGNEINPGMLLPDGSSSNYDQLTKLLKKGIQAVRDTTPAGHEVKIMLHLAEGGKNDVFRSFFDAMKSRNVDYDVIGASYYAYWHGPFNNLKNNLNDMAAQYGKEVLVAETSYGHTLGDGDGFPDSFTQKEADEAGFPVTVEGQAQMLTTVMNTVAHVPNGKGVGVFYWEPAWIPVPKDAEGHYQAGWKSGEGSGWNNQALFDFNGNALSSLDVFKFEPGDLPNTAPLMAKNSVGITVSVNESASNVAELLPKTVDVLYNEGSVLQVPLVWEEIDQEDLSRIGTFEVSGEVEGIGKTVKIIVTVTSYKNVAKNPGFENNVSSTGWTIAGSEGVASFKVDSGNAYAGTKAVNYWSQSAYKFTLSQSLTGLTNGTYVLKARVSGGGGENAIHLYAEGYGGEKLTSDNIVNSGWQQWNEGIIGSIEVTNGQATIGIDMDAPASSDGIWGWIDSFEFYQQVPVPEWGSSKTLTATDVSARSVKLVWSGVSGTDPVTGYKIYKNGKLLTSVTGAEYTVANLSPNTTYAFKVETSFDGAIWTSTGPTVSVATTSDPSSPVTPKEEEKSTIVNVPADQLTGGKTVVNVPAATTEIKLPANTGELLGGAPLQLKADSLELDIPAALLGQLIKGLETGETASSISLTIKPLSDGDASKLITQLENTTDAGIRVIGALYDFGLSVTTSSGKTITLTQFNEPITIRIQNPGTANSGPVGIFYIAGDGSVQYIGGQQEGDFISAKVSHFSKYALLEVKKSFVDVPATYWGNEAIGQLAARLLVSGTGANVFEPNRKVTRAEYVSMLVKALKLEPTSDKSKFTDVPADAWYAGAISAAYDAGLIQGNGANRFDPNHSITREEIAKLAVQALTILKGAAATDSKGDSAAAAFTDTDQTSTWAKPYVQSVSDLGLMRGRESGRFVPKADVTRAEAAQIIWNLLLK
jgi:arabinogalactan endo-1,4-beta-galactosidase